MFYIKKLKNPINLFLAFVLDVVHSLPFIFIIGIPIVLIIDISIFDSSIGITNMIIFSLVIILFGSIRKVLDGK